MLKKADTIISEAGINAKNIIDEATASIAERKQDLEHQVKSLKETLDVNKNCLKSLEDELSIKKGALIELDEKVLLQNVSLYEPMYDFVNSDRYKEELDKIRSNQKAGYVYVISNIGSFGEGVYKIGMTRRLDPMDRVRELGDASVPFGFDIHAMIFSDNAPKLEAAIHKAFENRKVNMVNTRREFFRVSLDEIKDTINKNFDGSVDFIETADAEQFRESEKLWQQMNAHPKNK